MTARRLPAGALLSGGLLLGVLGNSLLRAPGAPGLNLTLWAAAVAVMTVLLHRYRHRIRPSAESIVLLLVAVLFAAGFAWRDSPALKLLALLCVVIAFALPALRAGTAWIRRGRVTEYALALAASAGQAAIGAALTVADMDWHSVRNQSGGQTRWKHAIATARGLVLAIPFVVVFGGLFMAADAVFASMVADVVRIDFEELASHALPIAFLAWVSTGYMRGFNTGSLPGELAGRVKIRAPLSITEVGVVLGVLNLLFLVFIAVQFRYLFGGGDLVEVTPGLTYAEYARRGFFELVTVAALMLPLILAADALLRRNRLHDEYIFRSLTGMQIVLLLAVMASALQRMKLYQSAYGLTEQRFYATALLLLLAFIVVWFAGTVLRGRRRRFAFGALLASFSTVAALYVVNPDAAIARTNIERAQAGATAHAAFDAAYIGSLSGDAVPTILAAFPSLPAAARCRISRRLLDRFGPESPAAVRSWSWSSARARAAVREHGAVLSGALDAEGRCE